MNMSYNITLRFAVDQLHLSVHNECSVGERVRLALHHLLFQSGFFHEVDRQRFFRNRRYDGFISCSPELFPLPYLLVEKIASLH